MFKQTFFPNNVISGLTITLYRFAFDYLKNCTGTVKSGNLVTPAREKNFFSQKFLWITWCFFLIKSCLNSGSKWYQIAFEKFLISKPPFFYICMGDEITGPSTNFVTPSKLENFHSLR